MNKDFLLQTYGQCYGPEAGPWNLSVENKYLEYMFTKFFEENFNVTEYADICNIGIGAGYWDRYLSYKLVNGSLTSIDIDENSCQQFKVCLENENNPNKVNIICSDVMLVEGMDEQYDIVTMVGSARLESGLFETIIEKAFAFLKRGGSLYYQSVDKNEAKESVIALCEKNKMQIDNYLLDTAYGFKAQYWKITK